MIQMRDLQRQRAAMSDEIAAAVSAVLDSGHFIMGSQVEELEQRLASYVGVRHCVSCASGTDALVLALRALGIGQGDAVYVPDFTFFATAEAVAAVGATPVFVDVCADTYNISLADLALKHAATCASALTPRAVIPVNLFGLPVDYAALLPFARQHGLLVVQDGAQSFGAQLEGRQAMALTDIAATSFFPSKPLGCYGDGGAVFTNSDEHAALLRSLRVHGRGQDKYDNVRLGYNSRLDTLQAAVLLVKLRHLDVELRAVERVATLYTEALSGKVQCPVVPEGYRSAWAQYTIRTECRVDLQRALAQAGVPTAVYYPRPMSRQSAFAYLGQQPCPVASALSESVLSLPMHPYLTDQEIETIISAI